MRKVYHVYGSFGIGSELRTRKRALCFDLNDSQSATSLYISVFLFAPWLVEIAASLIELPYPWILSGYLVRIYSTCIKCLDINQYFHTCPGLTRYLRWYSLCSKFSLTSTKNVHLITTGDVIQIACIENQRLTLLGCFPWSSQTAERV